MTPKGKLWYMVENFMSGKYKVREFCSEFSRIYNFEIDYNTLNEKEHKLFKELCDMADRFSDYEEDLKIANVFCSEQDIFKFANNVVAQKENLL